MELMLVLQDGSQVAVRGDDEASHTFDLRPLLPDLTSTDGAHNPLRNPAAYGRVVFDALFPANTDALHLLDAGPDSLLLVATDPTLQAIPWEYAYGPDGFLVTEYPFARGLPTEQAKPRP